MTACEWRVGPAGLDELRIVERLQRDGTVFYAVTRAGWVANRGPRVGIRGPAVLARCRLHRAHALA
jgi:hypothetical protein